MLRGSAAGGAVAVWDADAEREGDVIFAGAKLRPGAFRFLLAERAGHTEATVALCVAAGLPAVGVCCEAMNRDGTMADPPTSNWPRCAGAVPVMIAQRPAR